ncbi:MAG: activator of (R)-2-hydroxyglutaryl-CoA dehydratase [Bryobacteraceae bacterium]|jgi:predicted nucleotide-binding protein (sugar kinase/HSP70/actin superfamily)
MSTQPFEPKAAPPAGLVQINSGIEDIIQKRLAEERARLEREAGVVKRETHQFKKPVEHPFTKEQRSRTTLLFGGLTWKHEKLVHGALEGLGYIAEAVPTPNVSAFQAGKEYGNNGQCNPTYFTVGNLVQYLQSLEEQGLTKQEIIDRYVFFTAGACGPCRFGMYEAEYRLALRNSGFDGFRVLLFQQSGGLSQSDAEAGLEMNLDFFLGILNALNCGDVLNEVAYAVRPYEVNAGETDQKLDECMEYMHEVFRKKQPWQLGDSLTKYLGGFKDTAEYIGKFVNQLKGDEYIPALHRCRDAFNEVEIDRLRVKPIVKITGEFWAQTTEGDGNFNMFNFLQREGAQVLVEPIGTWIMYMIHQVVQKYKDFKGLEEGAVLPPMWRLDKRVKIEWSFRNKVAKLKLAEAIFKNEYHKIVGALGDIAHHLADQYELQRLGHPFYNSRAGGGEGHLEVAKNIYYSNKDLAHMVLSVKPFGCMPSTQSDGAQSAVVSNYKDMIYLPVETSGEGEINAHSRVQMALGEAKNKAKKEMAEVLERTGLSLDDCRAWVDAHPESKRPVYHVPHSKGVVGLAANFVMHIAEQMRCGAGSQPAAASQAALTN